MTIGRMATLANLDMREIYGEEPGCVALAKCLVARKAIRLTTTAMLKAAVRPMAAMVVILVTVLLVTVIIIFHPKQTLA